MEFSSVVFLLFLVNFYGLKLNLFDFIKDYQNNLRKQKDERLLKEQLKNINNGEVSKKMIYSWFVEVREALIEKECYLFDLIHDYDIDIRKKAYLKLYETNQLKDTDYKYLIENKQREVLVYLFSNTIYHDDFIFPFSLDINEEFINLLIKTNNIFITDLANKFLYANQNLLKKYISFINENENESFVLFLLNEKLIDFNMIKNEHITTKIECIKEGIFLEELFYDQNKYISELAYKSLIDNKKNCKQIVDKAI